MMPQPSSAAAISLRDRPSLWRFQRRERASGRTVWQPSLNGGEEILHRLHSTVFQVSSVVGALDAHKALWLGGSVEEPLAERERNDAVIIAVQDQNRCLHGLNGIEGPKLVQH